MSRPVNPDFEVNREELVKLIIEAKGNRNRKQFAEDANLSVATVSALVHNRFEKPPTPSSLKKIAESTDMVSYEKLLRAAGYKPERYIPKEIIESSRKEKADRANRIVRSIMITYLTDNQYFASLPGKYNANMWSLAGDKIDGGRWYLDYVLKDDELHLKYIEQDHVFRKTFEEHLGRYILECHKGDRVSMVTDSKELFDYVNNMKPLPIKVEVSVILVDTETISVVGEASLS